MKKKCCLPEAELALQGRSYVLVIESAIGIGDKLWDTTIIGQKPDVGELVCIL